MSAKKYPVKDVAAQSNVSVRTLHHYDAIGLLSPAARTAAGYRLYSEQETLRLQQIMLGRELGMSLEQIRSMLDDADTDRRTLLLEQRELLVRRMRGTERMVKAVDAALDLIDGRSSDTETTMEKIFDGFDHSKYEAEAKERWGHTGSYADASRRTKSYSDDDWRNIKSENAAIMDALAELMHAGTAADSQEAMDLAEAHRTHIDRWYYRCAPMMHVGLADMYLADSRFQKNIDRHGEGLHAYLAEAIKANATRKPE
jgi:DNA-binding transcriptional MerR regulator